MPLTVCHPLAAMLLGIFAVDAEESVPGIVYVSAVKAAPFPSVVAEGEEGRPRYGRLFCGGATRCRVITVARFYFLLASM